jgi:hypothetical protein
MLHSAAVLITALALCALPVRAGENLANSDLKEGMAGWHGDGSLVFLNPDGTEGSEGDPGVTPVIKLELTRSGVRSVYQEVSVRDQSTQIAYKVEISAASKIVRSTSRDDYTSELFDYHTGDFHWTAIGTCNTDFWLRAGSDPNWYYVLGQPSVGQWTTVSGSASVDPNSNSLNVLYCVPPGEGAVYLRNPSASSSGK